MDMGESQERTTEDQQKLDAVEVFYHTYRAGLFNYLVNICPGGQEEAFEILHETYIRLLKLDNLEHLEQSPRAYIFTIATNLSRDAMRRRASRKLDVHDEFNEMEFISAEPTPTELLDWTLSLDKLKQTLTNLPQLTRNIFLLSRFEEMSYPQIAEQLQLSTRTVERHMATAMKVLQKSFEDIL